MGAFAMINRKWLLLAAKGGLRQGGSPMLKILVLLLKSARRPNDAF
jgi:hypothetical protein